jgi:hypothetical protein
MSDLSRRGFLGSMGAVALGFMFRGKGGQLVEQPLVPNQAPSAVDIIARPQVGFRAEHVVVAAAIAPLFVIEDIKIGDFSQIAQASPLPAAAFSADAMSGVDMGAVAPDMEIRFRVRYVGKDPRGARFYASIIGSVVDGRGRAVLPIDSGVPIVA